MRAGVEGETKRTVRLRLHEREIAALPQAGRKEDVDVAVELRSVGVREIQTRRDAQLVEDPRLVGPPTTSDRDPNGRVGRSQTLDQFDEKMEALVAGLPGAHACKGAETDRPARSVMRRRLEQWGGPVPCVLPSKPHDPGVGPPDVGADEF